MWALACAAFRRRELENTNSQATSPPRPELDLTNSQSSSPPHAPLSLASTTTSRASSTLPFRHFGRHSRAADKARKASLSATNRLDDMELKLSREDLLPLVREAISHLGLVLSLRVPSSGTCDQPQMDPQASKAYMLHRSQYGALAASLVNELVQSPGPLFDAVHSADAISAATTIFDSLTPPDMLTVEEYAGFLRRYQVVVRQHALLRPHGISLDSESIRLIAGATGSHLPAGSGDQVVLAAAQHCPQVVSVTLQNGLLHNGTLTTLARTYGTQLQELDLSYTQGFDDLGLKSVAAYCPSLRVLRISACWAVSELGILAIAKHCPSLQELEISDVLGARPRPVAERSTADQSDGSTRCAIEGALPPSCKLVCTASSAQAADQRLPRASSSKPRGSGRHRAHAGHSDLSFQARRAPKPLPRRPPPVVVLEETLVPTGQLIRSDGATPAARPDRSRLLRLPALAKPYAMRERAEIPEERRRQLSRKRVAPSDGSSGSRNKRVSRFHHRGWWRNSMRASMRWSSTRSTDKGGALSPSPKMMTAARLSRIRRFASPYTASSSRPSSAASPSPQSGGRLQLASVGDGSPHESFRSQQGASFTRRDPSPGSVVQRARAILALHSPAQRAAAPSRSSALSSSRWSSSQRSSTSYHTRPVHT